MSFKIQERGNAFTLMEMMIAIGIAGLLFVSIFSILTSGRRSWDIGANQQDLQDQLRLGLANVSRELYFTSSTKITLISASNLIFQVPVGETVLGNISNIRWGADAVEGQKVSFLLDNNRLIRRVLDAGGNPVGADRVLANNITSLIFTQSSDKKTVTIALVASVSYRGQIFNQSSSASITCRN